MKAAIFLAKGYEEIEALTVVDMFRRAKIEIDVISTADTLDTESSHGVKVKADKVLADTNFDEYGCLVLPGGMPGTKNLEANEKLMKEMDKAYESDKLVCAICAAPSVFGHRGYLKGRKAVCYPGFESELMGAEVEYVPVAEDGNVITSRGMGTAILFAAKIIERIIDKKTADELLKAIVFCE